MVNAAGQTPMGDTALKLAVPLVLIALWTLARRLRTFESVLDRYPYARAFAESALALAGAWSVGMVADLLREGVQHYGAFGRPGLYLRLAVYLGVSYSIARFLEAVAASHQRRGQGESLSRLSRAFLYGINLFVGLLAFLAANDFTTLTVVAGGVAALLAFALRQTLTDVVSGVALGIERSFRRQDWVMLEDGTAAVVIDMDWRATHLRGWDRATFLVPNSQLARQSMRLLPKRGALFADSPTVLMSGKEEPTRVKPLIEQAVGKCEEVQTRPAPVLRLADASTIP